MNTIYKHELQNQHWKKILIPTLPKILWEWHNRCTFPHSIIWDPFTTSIKNIKRQSFVWSKPLTTVKEMKVFKVCY